MTSTRKAQIEQERMDALQDVMVCYRIIQRHCTNGFLPLSEEVCEKVLDGLHNMATELDPLPEDA